MMKRILYLALAVVLLLVVGFSYLISTMDARIKESVEKNVTHLTGSPTSIESVDFSVFSGKGLITGLRVSNPEGFSENPALTLGKILFEVDMAALSRDTLTVKQIKAESIGTLVERNSEGSINFQVLSQNLKEDSQERGPAKAAGIRWKPNLKINECILSEGKVTLSGFGESSSEIVSPELRLLNLGGTSGAPPEEIAEEILSKLFFAILKDTLQSGLLEWIEKNKAIPDALKDLINQGLGSIN